MDLFISPSTPSGLQGEGNASLVYLYGLSDYWVDIFEDRDLIESVLEVHTMQMSEVYSKFLQLTGNMSLQSIQAKYNTQIELILIDETQVVEEMSGMTFKLKSPISDIQYLMNRPLLPTDTLESGVHFEISDAGDTITFYKPLRELPFPRRPTEHGTEEYALWASNINIDEGIIQSEYGELVGMTPEKAIGTYKEFLQGLYFLYSHGPNITHIERGLNLSLGLPYARSTEKVISMILDQSTGHWIVITPTQYYDIPYGFRPDLDVGDTIVAGQQLASWIEIKDYRKSGNWWANMYIPKELIDCDPFVLGPCTEGSAADEIMIKYLKNHTFQVLLKQSGVSLDAYNTVREVVDRVKPSYTFPVYIWQAPVGDEVISLEEDFRYDLESRLDDIIGVIPISQFRRDTLDTGIMRGHNWYNRMQVPVTIRDMVGDNPDPDEDIDVAPDGTVISGMGGWIPEITSPDNYEIGQLSSVLRNRGDMMQCRLRGTSVGGYRSVKTDTYEGLTWTIPKLLCYPPAQEDLKFNERMMTPLYIATGSEINVKMRSVQVAFDVEAGFMQAVTGIDLVKNYHLLMKRDPGSKVSNIGIPEVGKEEDFVFYNTEMSVNPTLSEYATIAYLPPISSMVKNGTLLVVNIFMDTYAVYWLRQGITHAPTYIPVDNEDNIDMTVEFDYTSINMPAKPSVINRSSAELNCMFLRNRARPDGEYRDSRSGYTLHLDRSGIYGPRDQPLRAYKRI